MLILPDSSLPQVVVYAHVADSGPFGSTQGFGSPAPLRCVWCFSSAQVFADNWLQPGGGFRRYKRTVGDNRALQGIGASALAAALRQQPGQIANRLLRDSDVELHHSQDLTDINRAHALMPAIIISHQRQHRITKFGFTREPRLLHRRHADNVDAPTAVEIRFRTSRELRSLD